MNQLPKHILLFCLMFCVTPLFSQNTYPQDYFRSPVDSRILLSGTFGELRSGHFHSGIDIKTGGVSGKAIYAVADGWVSRIKVSAFGFGKTLYVTHPNGFVSVYAHLESFSSRIASHVKSMHYELESFELDIFPEKDLLPVKKGDVIALSGNSGGSNGPHLHFEMRLEATQTPVNPLLFGLEVKDYIRPEIHWLKVIPAGPGSLVDGKPEARIFTVEGWGENHRLKGHDTIHVSGDFSLAINTFDKLNDAPNKNGVYAITLYADGEKVYHHDLEKFDFVETRYINSLIDYAEYVENSRRYQRSEIDPNNRLSIYKHVKNNGILSLEGPSLHRIEYVVADFRGNVSRLPFMVISSPPATIVEPEVSGSPLLFSIDSINAFRAVNFSMMLPGSCLYRDIWFVYDTLPMPAGAYSPLHRIHSERVPLHRHFDVSVVPEKLPADPEKMLLARIDEKGKKIPHGGKWDGDALTASIRSFGDYAIFVDTIPPEIIPLNISSGVIKDDRKTVRVKISDDFSGIKTYRAMLNGRWLLMDYDAKNDLLVYDIDERLRKGNNQFRLEVTDDRNNMSVFEKVLRRE